MAVAVSAVVAGGAVLAGVVTAATVAEVALGLTVVGAVTGSKELTQLGAGLGLGGGLGGLASDAGMFGEVAGGASDAATSTATTNAVRAGSAEGTALGDLPTNQLTGVQAQESALQTGVAQGGAPALQGAGGNVNAVTGQVAGGANTPAMDAGWGANDPLGNATTAASNPTQAVPGSSSELPVSDPAYEAAKNQYYNQASTGVSGAGPDADFPNGVGNSSTISNNLASRIADSLGESWKKLDPRSQAEILKSVMAIPGGIQAQQNKAKELALQQQRVNQTSYGSQVPTFGLINKARVA